MAKKSSIKTRVFSLVLALVVLVSVSAGAVWMALSALNAQLKSTFSVSYVAHNVICDIICQSQKTGEELKTFGSRSFDGSESEKDQSNVAEFQTQDFVLTSASETIEIYYLITNKGSFGFGVSAQIGGNIDSNISIKYSLAYSNGTTRPATNFNLAAVPTDMYLKPVGQAKSCLLLAMQISVNNPEKSAKAENVTMDFVLDSSVDEPAPPDIFITSKKQFDVNYLNTVLQQISGDATTSIANMTKIDEMATAENQFNIAGSDADDFRKNNNGEDIIVTLGGLTWHVCYLSQDKNGNDILTLWLTFSQQDAWKDRKADEGKYYGYIDGSLYSDWSANWSSSSTSLSYPSSMYGTSYIRAVTLNNGGSYSTSGGESLLTYTKNKESLFALFTVEDLGLTDYIVKPKDVEWQESGQLAKDIIGYSCNLPNENWSSDTEKVPDTGFYGSGYNYAHKGEYNSAWANDYLWLPSMSETGYNSGTHGLWQLDVAQRKNGSFSSTSSVGNVGQTSGVAYNYSWLRSGTYSSASNSYPLNPSGSGSYNSSVGNSYAVRPALHLNLTKIANELAA